MVAVPLVLGIDVTADSSDDAVLPEIMARRTKDK
jgi:hypothetical protein